VFKDRIVPHWFGGDDKLWYRNDLKGGTKEFVLVDAAAGTKGPAFDHAKLAAGLSKAAGAEYKADRLPFDDIEFTDDGKAVRFEAGGKRWQCDLATYECSDRGPARKKETAADPAVTDEANDDPDSPFAGQQPDRRPPGRSPFDRDREVTSPDGKWVAFVKDYNVHLRPKDGGEAIQLSKGGVEGNAFGMLSWSPDGKAVVGFRIEPGENKEVHLLQSSPAGGGRARLTSRPYPLPGDKFTAYEPWVFDPAGKSAAKADAERIDFGRPRVRWNRDRRHFTYEKVDRGHQRFRLVEVDSHTGKARTVIDETSKTFIWTAHTENVGVPLVTHLEKSDELIYSSEKDGWRHLYLIDAKAGTVKNPITKGEYVVRGVERIDEEKRQIWFRAGGKNPGQDPYFVHHYRVNFDGTGLVALTEGDGTHTVQFSPARKYLIDTYSRVDAAPVHELRRCDDGKLVCELERADITELKAGGWTPPEVFVAKGRDGTTDIWGIICRPRDFDPAKKYPVIEQIYAGPQGSFVPKAFSPFRRFSNLTDLGFIVVQMDGMGTANRSKAFHDACWKNLKDAGFPDRILWHKAVAAKYPYYDITRVGIYGTSAGGQNAAGAVLFHGDFYTAACAACGCHDNRMDKASWNEQWMGYPVGPEYAASSNIDNARRLRGKLMLILGEMDTNVPPESTYRLCDALVKAGKDFDFILIPGMGHSNGGLYGTRRMLDFFVRHLQGKEPPDRNGPPRAEPPVAEKPATPPPQEKKAEPEKKPAEPKKPQPPDLAALTAKPVSEAAVVVRRYETDRGSLTRAYPVPFSATRTERLSRFYAGWIEAIKAADLEKVSPAAREELAKLRATVEGEFRDLHARAAADAAVAPLVPFAGTIVGLEEARRRMEPVDPEKAAGKLAGLPKAVAKARAAIESRAKSDGPVITREAARRAADATDRLRASLKAWFAFYDGYDPQFTWWAAHPYKQADLALDGYAKALRDAAGKLPEDDAKAAKSAPHPTPVTNGPSDAPDLVALLARPRSEMVPVLQRYGGGRGWRGSRSGGDDPDRDPALWLGALAKIDFDKLSRDGQVEYILLRTRLQLEAKRRELRGKERPTSVKDDTGISGRPIGRDALRAELTGEMIPYSPDELIALARQELAWCDAEVRRAAREMGFGDDWKKAVERVKTLHVRPGEQPKLIRELAVEAVEYLRKHELVTVPPLAAETWRMEMMSPERQLVNPFFTGGEVITVSFPTHTMSHEAKLQSMRGNNPHFARATVHHELIPGHHLQGFTSARENTHRGPFGTAFWTEGMAVYWEMVLYDRGFPKTPEDRVGFLVWRMHRCARVIFSLGFHLGKMTPRECVDLLVERVGFEPDNAAAEVRRSFAGGYGPLYQAAYLVGAMQFRALRKELVDTGKMPERAFHDAILKANRIPVELIRADLTGKKLTRDFAPSWKFGGPGPAAP
jgi:dipeptidyl aminopeptidase/acylaminoacyl peptidase